MSQNNKYPRLLSTFLNSQWMILPDSMANIVALAQQLLDSPEALNRALNDSEAEPEMVAKETGKRLENTRTVEIRGDVAVIPVTGPIFRYANMCTAFCGAVSVAELATDFNSVLNNPKVKSILFEIDSPGGEASGICEFADHIFEARGKKPMTAYVSAYGCSAAYWIASAADEIVLSDTAAVGSIGVVSTVRKKKDDNTMEIVSTQSPNKRPDMETEEGRALMQTYVDDLASVFVSRVARNRGVAVEKVLSDYGQGDIMVGQKAIQAGLADRLGSFEGVLSEMSLKSGKKSTGSSNASIESTNDGGDTPAMDKDTLQKEHPELLAALQTEAAAQERARIQAVESQALPGHDALIQTLKFDGKTTGDQAAAQVLAAEKQNRETVLKNIADDANKPAPPVAINPVESTAEAVLNSMPLEERCKAEWEASPELQAEFKDGYKNYFLSKKYSAEGRVVSPKK